jgi:hypothetical protein
MLNKLLLSNLDPTEPNRPLLNEPRPNQKFPLWNSLFLPYLIPP